MELQSEGRLANWWKTVLFLIRHDVYTALEALFVIVIARQGQCFEGLMNTKICKVPYVHWQNLESNLL